MMMIHLLLKFFFFAFHSSRHLTTIIMMVAMMMTMVCANVCESVLAFFSREILRMIRIIIIIITIKNKRMIIKHPWLCLLRLLLLLAWLYSALIITSFTRKRLETIEEFFFWRSIIRVVGVWLENQKNFSYSAWFGIDAKEFLCAVVLSNGIE